MFFCEKWKQRGVCHQSCAGGPLGRESDFSSKPCHNDRTLSPSAVHRQPRQDGHLQPPMAKALQGGLGIVPSWTARERCGYLADAQAVAVVVTGLVTGHGAMVIDVIGVGVVDMIFLLLRFLGWRTCFGYTGRRTRRYHDFVLTQISVTNMSAIFHLPITSWIDSVLINSSPDVIICARIKSRCAGILIMGINFYYLVDDHPGTFEALEILSSRWLAKLSPSTVERLHRRHGHLQPPVATALEPGLGTVLSWMVLERCGYLAATAMVADSAGWFQDQDLMLSEEGQLG